MRKKEYMAAWRRRWRARAPELMLWISLPLVLLVLCGILFLVQREGVLTVAEAAYYGALLEYPAAGITIATVTALLLRYQHNKLHRK
ncbi:MAG: hypothetical protein E7650_05180 [Ruminococcaceae bacterium]|nr:hypothetical protein [Oscillospiraceae bacterium]